MLCVLCVFILFLSKAVTLIPYGSNLFLIMSIWMNVSLPTEFPQLSINHYVYYGILICKNRENSISALYDCCMKLNEIKAQCSRVLADIIINMKHT